MKIYASLSPELAHVRVRDCMHHGILTCAADAPLAEVAGVMASHRVHAVVITPWPGDRPVAIVSALDVLAAAGSGEATTALQAAVSEPLTVSADESLARATQLMVEHEVSHLVVVEGASGFPSGVLSTLDIAGVLGAAHA